MRVLHNNGIRTFRNFIDRTVSITRGVIIGSSQTWCRWKCLEENIPNKPVSSRHFHRHQFREDPIITPRVIETVRSIKLRTVHNTSNKNNTIMLCELLRDIEPCTETSRLKSG
ncbi:hypothetical protein AVEN_216671-1 [Araneus ventricosus]|uniref:Uncharacterized protein n=1 Tax=Araneus ventricosus TaxID=182803 RepID=A0A4Y2DXB8_ARAVE|nr:hypothetical protein AVEN_216671-1 [Araneus ventricosus]